jgi:predicted secreted protein
MLVGYLEDGVIQLPCPERKKLKTLRYAVLLKSTASMA